MDIQPKNLNALLIGTGEFAFADGAASVAAALAIGFKEFGNIAAYAITTKNTTKEHYGSYRGVRRLDRTFILQTQLGYEITAEEWNLDLLRYVFYGDKGTNYSQTAKTAVAVDALTTPAINLWYDLLISGAHVRRLTTVAIVSTPSVVENTDYVIDYELARLRWLTTPPGTLTSISVTAPAITATQADTLGTINPLVTPVRTGFGRITCWDQPLTGRNLVWDHADFYCQAYLDGNVTIDGQKESEIKIKINVLPPVGTLFVRDRN